MRSYGETRCQNQQKPKTQIKNQGDEEVQEFRENLVDERSLLEPRGDPSPGHRDTSSSSHELPVESRAKVDPVSGKHGVYTHFPKDPNCDICLRTKITRASCRRRAGTVVPRAEKFGDLITADHKVLSEGSESPKNHRYAVVVQDLATQWLQSYPCKTKTSQETQKSLMKFLEPTNKPKVIYTDNSLEIGKSCEEFSWNHCTSTPHRSETNGIAERAVRRVKEGTSAVLLQSGLNESWWADSMECYTYLRNVTDLLSDGKTRGGSNKTKTRHACILEADESTRLRTGESLPNHHEDHIAGKGDNSLHHYITNLFLDRTKITRAPCRRRNGGAVPGAEILVT